MRKIFALAAALATLPALAQAQAVMTWAGQNLSISGNRANGCDLRVVEVTHSGSQLSALRVMVANRAQAAMRLTAELTLTGDNQRKTGTFSGVIGGGQVATLQGIQPFGGSLAGTRVAVVFHNCTVW